MVDCIKPADNSVYIPNALRRKDGNDHERVTIYLAEVRLREPDPG